MPTILQWVKLLEAKIEEQIAYARPYEARYRNEHVLPFLIREYREVYGARVDGLTSEIEPPRSGTAAIVVDALTDRLTVLGSVPIELHRDDAQALEAARVVRAAWERNDLDVMHREAHREALIKRSSYAQVGRSATGRAVVGIESAEQMAVHRSDEPPYDIDAAMKIAADEWTGQRKARLWLQGRTVNLVEGASWIEDPEGSGVQSRWSVVDDTPRAGPVPVVEFAPRARLTVDPISEIEPIVTGVDIVDLVDGLMVFAGHFGAVPIRWASGLEPVRDPKDPTKYLLGPNGKPMIGFNPRADHLWGSTSKDTKFGQLEPAGLASFVTWAEHATNRIRAKTQIASTYFLMDLKSHMSAELLKTDEAPMVRRINSMGRRGSLNQSHRRLQRLMLAVERPDLADAPIGPLWEDPATRIESQDADRFSKLVPHLGARTVAEEVLGWSPEMAEQAAAEAEELRARLQANDPLMASLSGALVLPDDSTGDV